MTAGVADGNGRVTRDGRPAWNQGCHGFGGAAVRRIIKISCRNRPKRPRIERH
jgi:hypothetical protein